MITETATFFNELALEKNAELLSEFEKRTPMDIHVHDEHEIIINGKYCDAFAEFLKSKNIEFRIEFNKNLEEFNEINAMRILENAKNA